MTDLIIRREHSGPRGRYVIDMGGEEAELTYLVTGPGLVVADHTLVPPSFRGSGAALALVSRLVADARAEGFRIVPQCSYIDAQRRKHPEWAEQFSI